MKVCVAICTWNRCWLLDQTLASLRRLSKPSGVELQVLVVNNNSTDATDEVIARHADHLPLTSVFEPTPGLSWARNRALSVNSSDLLLFTDDDVNPYDDWLEKFVAGARKYEFAAVFGGPIEAWFEVTPDPDLEAAFPSLRTGFCGVPADRPEGPMSDGTWAWGANLGVRPARLTGCFDTSLGNTGGRAGGYEEVEFQRRLSGEGAVRVWLPEMKVRHFVGADRMTAQYLRRFTIDRNCVGYAFEQRYRSADYRWLTRRVVSSYLSYGWYRLTGRRGQAMRQLHEAWRHRGMLWGWRELSRRAGQRPSANGEGAVR